MAIAVVAGGGAVTTMLVGLVTNAVSNQAHWPGFLGWVQRHAWASFALLGVVTVGFTALLAALSETRSSAPDTVPPRQEGGSEPPGAALVLRSLPRDISAFTDRTAELERLVGSVRTCQENGEALPVHVIDGMPGVGKTSFAVHAGHVLSGRFPDGQLFVNLNGHTTGRNPVQATEALASLLAATGVPAQQIPVGDDAGAVTEARAAMWRGQLADKRALLILDNAASYRQLEPLLPGDGGCLVLVTSRKRLAAHEEVVLQVEALSPEHAVALFVRLSGRSRDALDPAVLDELVRLCGCLPLGVSLLAARLRHHPTWSVADLLERLVAVRDRLGELRAGDRAIVSTFDLSYRDLPPERRYFFQLLGCYPGTDIDAYAGAAVGSTTVDDARRHLDALYDAHLIDEHPGSRYRLHDLLRDYARRLADEGDSMNHVQAVGRVCAYYLSALTAVNTHIARGSAQVANSPVPQEPMSTPPLDSRSAALGWLENERPNVLACIKRANELDLHGLVIRLAAAMAPFLRQSGPWDQAVGLHRAAAEAARRTGDRRALAGALAELGVVRRCMAAYPEAVEALHEAEVLYEAVGDRKGRADALNQAGIVRYMTADNEAAVRAQSEALSIYRELGDRLGQANALADLGMVRRQMSRFDEAVEAQSEALSIYRELHDRYGEANSLRDLGIVHCLMGEYDRAARRHREAFDIYQELDDRHHQAYALNELGLVRRLVGDVAGSHDAHTQALEIYTDLGDRFGRANSVRHLGALHRVSGRAPEAIRLLEQALETYRELGARGGIAATLSELGSARGATGEREAAVEAFARSLEIHRELGDRCGEAEVLNNWGALLRVSDEVTAARDRFQLALGLAAAIRCPLEEARALEGIGRCDRSLGGSRGGEGPLRQAIAVYRSLGAGTAAADIERLLAVQPG
ncbi:MULTISPECIES: cyclophane-containing RiPP biosynthesis TPR protein HaaT [Streptomycetaceae]|uniref:Transcriptional activator domain containing protein n=1 Tax=Streptantibioticus cattleyicolor (strain ATCC 35852 / DSM 46488 / JCM 4925 / NBRC 14057 / NRRL 8057) TaxID=1003195 RepID=F8JNX9_STREN|nr:MULTISPECIES: cyclophane-containing RiPP biosynthesis TPR protein HaaT [Streptomycetaceae]AEW93920.1 transcriptional activator domain containing protein [Streptantibioticus cattleyicolor NRRL 8057 = DSM 46488]MYS58597.1 tetratricopeptide repeat protein [Streptomyces sp. SID5468]CCB74266.1 Transcriptional activator domain containing protein [Streptantibioticus cattleyicolor NRRL 8057 = DSM 46488]